MMRLILATAALVAASAAHADMAESPVVPERAAKSNAKPVVTTLFSGTRTALGQPLTLPQGDVEVKVTSYSIPPGAVLPVHKHPYPRFAYVLAGRLEVSTDDGANHFEYGPGDVVIEMLDAWHLGRTIGNETVKLLVIDQAPVGESNTVLR